MTNLANFSMLAISIMTVAVLFLQQFFHLACTNIAMPVVSATAKAPHILNENGHDNYTNDFRCRTENTTGIVAVALE